MGRTQRPSTTEISTSTDLTWLTRKHPPAACMGRVAGHIAER
jgi:hypothetical protein